MARRGTPLNMRFVLNSSLTMSWRLDGEAITITDGLLAELDDDGYVKAAVHRALEVGDAPLLAERHKRPVVHLSSYFPARLVALPIESDQERSRAGAACMALERTERLTVQPCQPRARDAR